MKKRYVSASASAQYVEAYLAAVEHYFKPDWLNQGADTEMQRLWSRSDVLAASELMTVGHALIMMSMIDEEWVLAIVQEMKSDSANNRKGAAFELCGASMFATGGMKIKPCPINFPGFDATVEIPGAKVLNVSINNHDKSHHEIDFRTRAAQLHAHTRTVLGRKFSSAQLLIFAHKFLNDADWKILGETVEFIAVEKKSTEYKPTEYISILAFPLPDSDGDSRLSPNFYSDSFVLVMPWHANEQKNFLAKLESAALNLKKHAAQADDQRNVILMRAHPTASTKNLINQIMQLIAKPDLKLDGVCLYQPTVQLFEKQVALVHYLNNRASPRLKNEPLDLRVPVGIIHEGESKVIFLTDRGDTIVDATDCYVYQQGDHYYLPVTTESPVVRLVAAGIRTHIDFGAEDIASFDFPQHSELEII